MAAMMTAVSVFLLFIVCLIPICIVYSMLSFLLNFVGGFFSRSLVDVGGGPPRKVGFAVKKRRSLVWFVSLVIVVGLMLSLPKAPDVDIDYESIAIDRIYSKALGIMQLQYADTLLYDLPFTPNLVENLCLAVPSPGIGEKIYHLECKLGKRKRVMIKVMNGETLVRAGVWRFPE